MAITQKFFILLLSLYNSIYRDIVNVLKPLYTQCNNIFLIFPSAYHITFNLR